MSSASLETGGVLAVNKPKGMTSHDVVNIMRKAFNTKKVGHTGTLDPMATGVLTILVGRAVKATEYIASESKKYHAVLRLGITTDTEDITGKILSESDNIPSSDEVLAVCEKFKGEIMQIPPMYSALKVNGKKLVDLARKGLSVERNPRPIQIYSLACEKTNNQNEYILDVHCSGGTYIRTLCADIGAELGCGGVMAELERTQACGYNIENTVSIETIKSSNVNSLISMLSPVETMFELYPIIHLPEFFEKLCKGGCEIYQKKIGTDFNVGQRVRLYGKNGFFALGEVIDSNQCKDNTLGSAVKSIKMFEL